MSEPVSLPAEVYILIANGASAVFGSPFKAQSRCAYVTRDLAERDIPRFRRSCCDPAAGMNYAEDNERLEITVLPKPLLTTLPGD